MEREPQTPHTELDPEVQEIIDSAKEKFRHPDDTDTSGEEALAQGSEALMQEHGYGSERSLNEDQIEPEQKEF